MNLIWCFILLAPHLSKVYSPILGAHSSLMRFFVLHVCFSFVDLSIFFFSLCRFLFLFNFSGHSCILCPFVLVLFSYFNYYKVTNQLNASFMKFSVQFIVTLLYNVSNAWRIFRNIRLGWRLKVLQFMML